MTNRVTIVEVGPRDGLQNEAARIATADKVAFVQRLAAAGLPVVEVTSFVRPDRVPQLADAREVFAALAPAANAAPSTRYTALVPNLAGLREAVAAGVREVAIFAAASEGFSQRNTNRSIAQSLAAFADVCAEARAAGVRVRGYLSTAFGCPFDGAVDPRRVGLVGSSSGGQLALLHAVKPDAPEHAGVPIVGPDGSLDASPGDASVAVVLALYPVADPLARYRYALSRVDEPAQPSGFQAKRLIDAHHGYFADEAAMAQASVTRVLTAGEERALPPAWVAQPELDDNVPAAITDALVAAYTQAAGRIERTLFAGARHTFIQNVGADTDKAIALMRDFIGAQLRRQV